MARSLRPGHRALQCFLALLVALSHAQARPGGLWRWLTGFRAIDNLDTGTGLSFPRPPYEERATMARWLVHETTWGVLSTVDAQSGEAIGGVVSHSDGSRDHATGRIFFYLTPMDELTQNALSHPRCTFTVSEMQRRATATAGSTQRASIAKSIASAGVTSGDGTTTSSSSSTTTTTTSSSSRSRSSSSGRGGGSNGPCGALDPEDPACARATYVGRVLAVPEQDRELAQTAMFSRHPAMADWPTGHQFNFYELHVTEVHVLDWYGGMSIVDANEYYSADVGASPAGSGSLPSSSRGKGGRGAGGTGEVVLKEGAGYRIVIPAKRLRGHA